MRRIGIISLWLFGGLIALIAIAAFIAFYTPPGRTAIKTIAETQLGGALNSKAQIGRLGGALPSVIVLEDVALSDDAGEWLTADEVTLRWRPFALLQQRIVIDEAAINGAYLRREPPGGEQDENDDGALQISILEEAPHIDLKALEIDRFRIDLAETPQILNGKGALRFAGPDIMLRLSLTSDSGLDKAEISLGKSPRSDRFYLEADLNSEANGAIATLLNLDGPLHFTASGDSPVDAAAFDIEATIGSYGALTATLLSDFDGFDGADIDLVFAPGARFAGIEELAAPLSLTARYDVKNRGGALNIESLASAIGDIQGVIDWRAPRGFVQSLELALEANLDDDYRPELQEIAGGSLSVQSQLEWRREAYALAASITGPLASLIVENGATDLAQRVSGDIALKIAPRDNAPPWFESGLSLNAALNADFNNEVSLQGATFETGDGSQFVGAAAYEFESDALRLDGEISARPALLQKFAPGMEASENLTGDFTLAGPLDRFTLNANLETPPVTMNGGALPPMTIEAALAGLPRLPNGDITARASNGAPRRLDAQLRSSENGTIRLPRLSYGGRGFLLEGTAQLDPARQTLVLDLAYNGEDAAEPWPGVTAIGNATADGVLSRDGALNRLNALAPSLAVNDIAVYGLTLTAEGPPGAVRLSLSSDVVTTPQTGEISDLTAAGQLDARAAPKLTLSAFEAIIRNNRARLIAPAQFDFEDGVAINNLRLAYGANGALALDGAFSDRRWRADAEVTKFNIPGADGQITGAFSLDTDDATPARGDFELRSLLLNEDSASISVSALWNGRTVRLTDNGDETLDMDLHLPALLNKSPELSVDTSGALDGLFQYAGDIQALAAYMPPVLQSIEGDLSADFSLAGSLEAPEIAGTAKLENGAYTEIESGFSLAGLHAEANAAFGGDGASLAFRGGARGAGQTREETLTFEGDVSLGEEPALSLVVNLDRAEFSAFPVNQVRADGSLTLSGPLDALKAEGDISILELDAEIVTPETTGLVDIEVVPYNDGAARPENITATTRNSGLDYAIRINADDRIFIRGRGLESEWSADVSTVNGREQPLILGAMTLRRGWLDFSGRRFDLTRGAVTFDEFAPNNPRLDIRAEYSTGDGVTAAIVVSGRAAEPEIELTSTPALPSEDIMSLILFGKPAQELSAFESLQTAEALASLSGVGPFGGEGLTGRLRRSVGLDLLNVDVDPENGGGSLTVGKYVADGVFISATQDAQGRNGAVSVTYEITDNIVVETELEQDGDQTLSANWKKDF